MRQPPFFRTPFFWGVKDANAFTEARERMLDAMQVQSGHFMSDNLIAMGRNLGFLDDEAFRSAYSKHAQAPHEKGIIWRTAVLVWAARNALRLDGDFVECGCYKGVSARIVADTIGFAETGRAFYLYDAFEHDPSMPHHPMPEHGSHLFEETKQRFADIPKAQVIKGLLPQSFEQGCPEKVAFLHIDMNHADAEIAALEVLWDRMAPGAILVLDDFGAIVYRRSHILETQWFKERGYSVLELPTSQGIVVK